MGTDGRRVRWGRVFRSDALLLHDADFDHLADVGLRTVYDLRSDQERETYPNRLPDGLTVVEVSLSSQSSGYEDAPLLDESLADGEAFLADLYLHLLERFATRWDPS